MFSARGLEGKAYREELIYILDRVLDILRGSVPQTGGWHLLKQDSCCPKQSSVSYLQIPLHETAELARKIQLCLITSKLFYKV